MDNIATRIKELRLEKKMSQAQLGQVIGVNDRTISNYESGKREPDIQTIKKLCDFFEVSSDYLLGFAEDY